MSDGDREIICRKCNERFAITHGECPKCGTEVREDWKFAALAAIGVLFAAVLVIADQILFAAIGLLLAGGFGYLLYDKRERIQRAAERRETASAPAEETVE